MMMFGICAPNSGVALPESSTLRLPDRVQTGRTNKKNNGQIHLLGSQFLSEKRNPDQSENYGYLSARGASSGRKRDFDWAAEGVVESSFRPQDEFYFGVPELFARLTNDDNDVQVTVGRQRRDWSRLDSDLNLGLWQPQLRWDYLNPIQQGLTGVFLDAQIESLTVSLFVSPIFLPDQGPHFHIEDGRFVSANRWFWQPQTRLSFAGNPSNLYYDLERPSEEDVVMNSSLGGMIKFDPSGPLYSQIAYAYKPMNQYFIGFECSSCIDASTLDARARIHPRVVNHHLATWETGWLTENDHAYFSLSSDRPRLPKIPEDWGGTTLNSLLIFGGSYTRKMSVTGFPLELGGGYMRSVETERNTHKSDLTGQVESSSERFLFEDLFHVSGKLELYDKEKSNLSLQLKYSYSVFEQGSWLSSKLNYRQDQLDTFFGFDILGSDIDPLSSQASLLSRYRSNDRVYGGFGFVF